MYRSAYSEVADGSASQFRESERLAFTRAIDLMKAAQQPGCGPRGATEALHFVERLWVVLMEDLADDGNGLPASLKASLISIGIWVLRRVEDMRHGKSNDFTSLIEVSETIHSGLGRQ